MFKNEEERFWFYYNQALTELTKEGIKPSPEFTKFWERKFHLDVTLAKKR